jgi:A/G-specific adenine glycosylase
MTDQGFAEQVIAWQRVHGRHDLPWQKTRDAYSIWVSEVMLQQTQVATVIPYYERFVRRFPDVAALAKAPVDDVLAQWSGLGYYSRGRNLHRAAQVICNEHGGRFPQAIEQIAALPGIGRSTAAAIAVFAFGAKHAILDGNVKRVLARVRGIEGYPGDKEVSDSLWQASERCVPQVNVEAYTQGLMDLGATVCLRSRPHCLVCPVAEACVARREGRVASIPAPRPRKPLPHRQTVMLVLERAGALLLEKRPAPGIWGGLWCFPEAAIGEDVEAACELRFGAMIDSIEHLPAVEHGFTHFSLTIKPQRLRVREFQPRAGECAVAWLSKEQVRVAAIPAPVKRIVELLASDE